MLKDQLNQLEKRTLSWQLTEDIGIQLYIIPMHFQLSNLSKIREQNIRFCNKISNRNKYYYINIAGKEKVPVKLY